MDHIHGRAKIDEKICSMDSGPSYAMNLSVS